MKKIHNLFVVCLTICLLSSCYGKKIDANYEAVFTYQPYVFGHGGIDMKAGETGQYWCWASTHVDTFKIVPVLHQVNMEDLSSNDNTPLDFHTAIITQIVKGKSPILLNNYGKDWFETNIHRYYCNRVRDYVSQYSPFDLLSNREVLNEIDKRILQEMQAYVNELSKKSEFPIIIKNVVIGKAIPNKEQLDEMNATAREVQSKQTQDRRAEAQKSREKAEYQRAIADKAYQKEMGLTSDQFIQLRAWDIIEKKQGANIDVLFNAENANKMWNIRR